MKTFLILLISLLLAGTDAWGATKLSKEECHVIVKDLESLSNMNPHDIDAKAHEALSQLRDGETLTSYFVAYNIYAENLFNRGKVDEAQKQIEQMLEEASRQSDKECKVIALRTQGQFYYKLGLYDRASDCFRRAMEMCPRYDSNQLEHCFTWSSTLFWLVQADLHCGRVEEAEHWISKMDGMMQWLEKRGDLDTVGYKPVMIRGLKAKIELIRDNREAAMALLDECPQFMREDIPSRAYVEYYVAKMLLALKEKKYADAVPILDELIEMHMNDFKPIAAEYLLLKGETLAKLGRYRESSETLQQYIELKDKVNQVALAEQLDELSAKYEVEKLQHERDNMRRQLAIAFAICVALIIIIFIVVASRKKLNRKNRTLANTISQLNRLGQMKQAEQAVVGESNDDEESAELLETANRVVEYINNTKCYLSADCSRDTIKEGMGVSERTLAKAIVAATGVSFVNYINRLRLQVSIDMLDENPEMTINDISSACGFGTVRQFQRIFKQHFDMSPSAYREARSATHPTT